MWLRTAWRYTETTPIHPTHDAVDLAGRWSKESVPRTWRSLTYPTMAKLMRLGGVGCVLLLAAGALAAGCVTSSSGSAPDAGFMSIDSGFGAEVSIGADGGPGADGAAGTAYLGSIHLTQSNLGGTFSTSASASFESVQLQAGAAGCTTATFGPCAASVCPLPAGDAGTPAYVVDNAGSITIAGASGIGSVTLTFDAAMMRYSAPTGMTQLFAGGDRISATGAGGGLPAFAAQTVTAPSDIVLPECMGTMCTDIDRTVDKIVTWTGGGAGKVQFTIETTSDTQVTALICLWDAAGGTGTAPAAALSMLDKADNTPGGTTGAEIVFPYSDTSFAVGSYPKVTFTVQGTGIEGLVNMSH
jgi:hypothetical protein